MASEASLYLAQQMYIAYYNRPADPEGLEFWASQFDQSDDLDQALAAFGNSAEFTDTYGSLESEELVRGLYQQMFNREPEDGGLEFYVNRLENGEATLASIAKQIADGAGGPDFTSLSHKIQVAQAYTQAVIDNGKLFLAGDIRAASNMLAEVGETQDTIDAGLARIPALIDNLAISSAAEDYLLGQALDRFFGTTGDNVYTAVQSLDQDTDTLDEADFIDGRDGDDRLVVDLQASFGGFADQFDGGVSNIETIEINKSVSGSRVFDAGNISGASTYLVDAAEGILNITNIGDSVSTTLSHAGGGFRSSTDSSLLAGSSDSYALTLDGVGTGSNPVALRLTGTDASGDYEVLALTANSATDNFIDTVDSANQFASMTVSGAGNLQIDGINTLLNSVDASNATGNVIADLSANPGITSIIGGSGDDSFRISSIDELLTADGGEGSDTLIYAGITGASQPSLSNFEAMVFEAVDDDLTLSGLDATEVVSFTVRGDLGGRDHEVEIVIQPSTSATTVVLDEYASSSDFDPVQGELLFNGGGTLTVNLQNSLASDGFAGDGHANDIKATGITALTVVNNVEAKDYTGDIETNASGAVTLNAASGNINATLSAMSATALNVAAGSADVVTPEGGRLAANIATAVSLESSDGGAIDADIFAPLATVLSLTSNGTITLGDNSDLDSLITVSADGIGAIDLANSALNFDAVTSVDASELAADFSFSGGSSAGVVIIGSPSGSNLLSGGSGADTITGGADVDRIDGGAGDDTLAGGLGLDVFVLSGGADSISDYRQGEQLLWDVSSSASDDFGSLLTGFATSTMSLPLLQADGSVTAFSGTVTEQVFWGSYASLTALRSDLVAQLTGTGTGSAYTAYALAMIGQQAVVVPVVNDSNTAVTSAEVMLDSAVTVMTLGGDNLQFSDIIIL